MTTGPIKPGQNSSLLGTAGAHATEAGKGPQRTNADRSADASRNAATGGKPSFDVEISDQAKKKADFQKRLLEASRGQPEIREDRVAALKAQIAAGTYQVDSGKVADGMLREAIKEHLALMDDV